MARFELPRLEFVGRFARNRGALLGACLILVVALAAVLAPLFFPADPLQDLPALKMILAVTGLQLDRAIQLG